MPKIQFFSHNVLIRLSKLLGQRRWNVGLGKTFNLSYHMIHSDCKSQSYAHLMVFNKMAAKARWPPKMPWKNNSSLDLNIPHLVWKFYGSRCFSFWGMVEQLKKWTKNNNNNSQKELDQNQESSPLLRWSLIIAKKNSIKIKNLHLCWGWSLIIIIAKNNSIKIKNLHLCWGEA